MPDDAKEPTEEKVDGTVTPEATAEPDPAAASETPTDENQEGEQEAPENKGNLGVALQQERQKIQELRAELETLRSIAGDSVLFDANGRPVSRSQQQPQSTGGTQVSAELEKLWEEDPRKAVQMEILSAMSWRDQQDSAVDKQEMEAAKAHTDFNQYRDVIRQYVRALPLDQRSKQGVVELAYYVVKGQASDGIAERAQQELLKRIRAGENVQGLKPGTVSKAPSQKGPKVTDEIRAVAEMMNMSVEDYLKNQDPKRVGAK
jgi:hypothetical protein